MAKLYRDTFRRDKINDNTNDNTNNNTNNSINNVIINTELTNTRSADTNLKDVKLVENKLIKNKLTDNKPTETQVVEPLVIEAKATGSAQLDSKSSMPSIYNPKVSKQWYVTKEKYALVNNETKNIINDYATELRAQKKAKGTQEQYVADLKMIAVYSLENLDNKSLLELTKRDVRGFLLWCQDDLGLSSARQGRLLSSLRTCLSFCEDDEDVYASYTKNVADKIKAPSKQKAKEIFWLDAYVCDMLYDYFMENKMYLDATFFALAIESAGRKGELIQVRKESITQTGNATNEVIGKRSKVFKLLYFDKTKKAAKKYLETRRDDDPHLFVTQRGAPLTISSAYALVRSWRPIIKQLTGQDIELNVHSLRHTSLQLYSTGEHWVCRMKKMGGIPLEKLKNISNHDDCATTATYLKSNKQAELEDMFGIKL